MDKRKATAGARVGQAGEIRSERKARMDGLRTRREGAYASNEASDSDRSLGREQHRLGALKRRLVEHHLPHAGQCGSGGDQLLSILGVRNCGFQIFQIFLGGELRSRMGLIVSPPLELQNRLCGRRRWVKLQSRFDARWMENRRKSFSAMFPEFCLFVGRLSKLCFGHRR